MFLDFSDFGRSKILFMGLDQDQVLQGNLQNQTQLSWTNGPMARNTQMFKTTLYNILQVDKFKTSTNISSWAHEFWQKFKLIGTQELTSLKGIGRCRGFQQGVVLQSYEGSYECFCLSKFVRWFPQKVFFRSVLTPIKWVIEATSQQPESIFDCRSWTPRFIRICPCSQDWLPIWTNPGFSSNGQATLFWGPEIREVYPCHGAVAAQNVSNPVSASTICKKHHQSLQKITNEWVLWHTFRISIWRTDHHRLRETKAHP